ncbi:MAG: SpoIIE family protein phosphatase, partial [Treponema sp.]|nr:SpoIIE family protein phosphatase [Treponema sp.]
MNIAFSDDATNWTTFEDFAPAQNMINPFIPVLVSYHNNDYVVFQAQVLQNEVLSYQLYLTWSQDKGRTWQAARLLTQSDIFPAIDARDAAYYHNQRPELFVFENKLYLSWERSRLSSTASNIWVSTITDAGISAGSAEKINESGNANNAFLFSFRKKLLLVYFDTRRGVSTIRLAQKNGLIWNETQLSYGKNDAVFAFPVFHSDKQNSERLSFVWQESKEKESSIIRLSPDSTCPPAKIRTLSFTKNGRTNAKNARFAVDLANDSSGIAGFAWSWSNNKEVLPPRELMNLSSSTGVSLTAEEEGIYYFSVSALDYAGNWSDVTRVEYHLDLTAPAMPNIFELRKDSFGFVADNSIKLEWEENSLDSDVAGFTWNLQYLSPLQDGMAENKTHSVRLSKEEVEKYLNDMQVQYENAKFDLPPARILGSEKNISYQNRRNGIYAFTLCAIDEVGNISAPSTRIFAFNKYLPETLITSLKSSQDIFGNITLDIIGQGFTYDGTISEIRISESGKDSYSLILKPENGDYSVVSDNQISRVKLGNTLTRGLYKISLYHTDRGLYESDSSFSVAENGTVKIEKHYTYTPPWKKAESSVRYYINIETIVVFSIFILLLVFCLVLILRIIHTINDMVFVRKEALALIRGDAMEIEKQEKIRGLKNRGVGLRLKLILFTATLIAIAILLTAYPLGRSMIRMQERTLAQSLRDRVSVLLDSVSTSTRTYLPQQDMLELSYLAEQKDALQEAKYITISSSRSDRSVSGLEYVWATSDSEIGQKISGNLDLGLSALEDETFIKIVRACEAVNDKAISRGGKIAQDIAELTVEGVSLALSSDSRSVLRREEIANITQQLSTELNSIMQELSLEASGSEPYYNVESLDRKNTDYLFYRPVLYRQGSSQEYVRGIVFIQVSTENLIKSINSARNGIIRTSFIIAIAAVIVATIGAAILATIIVRPIRELVQHVSLIGETSDKTKLQGKFVQISNNDEIGVLGKTVNDMTQSLVRAAFDEKLLMDGKVVQQTFLPLSAKKDGGKETTAELNTDVIQCFGYYEGASNVSGDYFDYKKLDNRWYVIIKCDASGHGVPAALIMTVVATLFRTYFSNWSFEKNGTRLDILVSKINDFIESLGIKGKFATIITCLFDTKTGDLYFCNAGDNIVHIYDSNTKKEKELVLTETPAAGPLPSSLVELRGGFKVEKTHLQKGDILFFYTDGIEEATRKFRNSDFDVVPCKEPSENQKHENHNVGQEEEQFGGERIKAIIESLFAKSSYTLTKHHNPESEELLSF